MGGIQPGVGGKRARLQSRTCPHRATMRTIAAGLERVVCGSCGHLSFRWHEDVSDYIERERSRAVTVAESLEDAGLFASQALFHIRSRYELHPEASALAV